MKIFWNHRQMDLLDQPEEVQVSMMSSTLRLKIRENLIFTSYIRSGVGKLKAKKWIFGKSADLSP